MAPKGICHLALLSGEVVKFDVSQRQSAEDVLDAVHSRLDLPVTDWRLFGHVQWLNPMDKLANISKPRDVDLKNGEFRLYHGISCLGLQDPNTILQVFFDTRVQFLKGYLMPDFQDYILCCAALILQTCLPVVPDPAKIVSIFTDEINPPMKLLQQYEASLEEIHEALVDKVIALSETSEPELIAIFLKSAEASLNFGAVFYSIMDVNYHKIKLAVSSQAIVQYEPSNIYMPKKLFKFNQLDDILTNEDILIIAIKTRRSLNTDFENRVDGTKTLPSATLRKFSFRCSTAGSAKKMWIAAVAQHKYYRSLVFERAHGTQGHNLKTLAERLNQLFISTASIASSVRSTSSLESFRSSSASSMPSARLADGALLGHGKPVLSLDRTKDEKDKDRDVYCKLRVDIQLIEEELLLMLEELKKLCVEEAKLTGRMPKEVFMTVLPEESIPAAAKRIGTAFKLENSLIDKSYTADHVEQLQADIQLHRKIVAAAERLANDRSTNKSVRKKRRRDLQAAAVKLRGLERGLYQLRMSASKPDISEYDSISQISRSRAGSGFSLNSLKHWPNFIGGHKNAAAKSCPTTPRGSVPDLSHEDAQSLSMGKALLHVRRGPAERTAHKVSSQSWSNSRCNNNNSNTGLPPTIPQRRQVSSTSIGCNSSDCISRIPSTSSTNELPTYSNIGYQSSVPYKSTYRKANFPTIQDGFGQELGPRSRSSTLNAEEVKTALVYRRPDRTDSAVRVVPIRQLDHEDCRLNNDYSTSSLDRRRLRRQQECQRVAARDSTSSGVSSVSSSTTSPSLMSRTTTFPVEHASAFTYVGKHGNAESSRIGLSISASRIQPAQLSHKLRSTQFDATPI